MHLVLRISVLVFVMAAVVQAQQTTAPEETDVAALEQELADIQATPPLYAKAKNLCSVSIRRF